MYGAVCSIAVVLEPAHVIQVSRSAWSAMDACTRTRMITYCNSQSSNNSKMDKGASSKLLLGTGMLMTCTSC